MCWVRDCQLRDSLDLWYFLEHRVRTWNQLCDVDGKKEQGNSDGSGSGSGSSIVVVV